MESCVRTILFTDLVGSVKMYSKISDAVAVELVRELDRQVVEILPQFKGTFIKSTGDGHLLVFDQSSDAARCALRIHAICETMSKERQQSLSVRIAAHTGPIVAGEGDLHGNTVNLSARLMSVAGSGETCVSAECWEGMTEEERKDYLPHGPEIFKGFTRYTYVYRRPTPMMISDSTVRPDAGGEPEISPLLLQALPKSPVFIVDLKHPQLEKTILLNEGQTHIFGRAPESTTPVPDKMFSSAHVALAVVDGVCWCFDLQSTNGTTYRGRRLKHRVPLAAPATLQLPNSTLEIKIPE